MCVFLKRTRRQEKFFEDYVAGSAYEAPPRGYRLHLWVSVTGLERSASGWAT